MALLNRLDPAERQKVLTDWIREQLDGAQDVRITDVEVPQTSGMSMDTLLFKASFTQHGEARSMDLVARVATEQPGLFEEADLEREFAIVEVLARQDGVPVPAAHWLEADTGVLGGAFMVVDRAYGRIPADDPPFTTQGWVLDLSPDERARMHRNAMEVVARIHAVDWQAENLDRLNRPEFGTAGVDQQLGRLRAFYSWAADGRKHPTVEAGLEWLEANAPADGELVLCWGDPRVGNMLFADDLSVSAALDWELATIADPCLDLAWWLFLQRHHTEGIGAPLPEGIPDRAATIALYEELSGRTAEHVDYYEVLAGVRSSIIMLRIGTLAIAGGAIPPDNPLPIANPSSLLLAKLLELPAPEGATADFLGNRG